MKAPSPAFSLYPKDILSDEACALMTHEQFGCYMRLLLHSWLEGSIPSDPTRLGRLLGINGSKFKAIWPGIAPCWEASADEPGRLVQGRQERQRAEQVAFRTLQAEKGARGGKSKAINKTPEPVLDPGYVPAVAGGKPEASLPSPSPSPSPFPSARTDGQTAGRQGGERANPLLGDRAKRESECLALVADLADMTGRDPLEVMDEASAFEGARGRALNPASMSDSRLAATLLDLRTNLAAAKAKAATAAKVLAPGEPAWQVKERKEQERRARILGTGTGGTR